MRHFHVALLIAFFTPVAASAQEAVAKSRIVSIGVFKNGLALVRQEVHAPGPGTYRLDAAPEPVHGSFWIKSNCPVETAVKLLEFDTPKAVGGLQEELAGRDVVIHLKDKASAAGTVQPAARSASGFLVLKTAAGFSYINPSEVAFIDVKGGAKIKEDTIKQQRPVLVLTVGKSDAKPTIFVSYLTHGFGWAPSYLVEIADGKNLSIEMAVAVRNELADLEEAEIKLITGSPPIQFAHVVSPLAPKQSLEKFLAGLKSDPAAPGDGADIQFESIGKRSMKLGESLSLSVGKSKVGYERVVEWSVSSDERGSIAEETWDVLHFKNPFKFPMAAAPALVMDKDQFNSQRSCSGARAGESSSLRFARSLDMRTRGQEREDEPKKVKKDAKPDLIRVGLYEYRRATINGEMTVTNQRKQPSKIMVRRSLAGKVLDADGAPNVRPHEEGLRAVNPTHEIVWTVNLAPGEEKTVRYRYQTLLQEQRPPLAFTW